MVNYTVSERILMVESYISGLSSSEVASNFAATFPNRPIPSHSTILRLHNKFRTTGCLVDSHDGKRRRRNTVLCENLVENMCLTVEENPSTTLTQLAGQFGISKSSCWKALKKEKYKSYKIRHVHELLPRDYIQRMEFCELWMEKINEDPNLVNRILFGDESTFSLHGEVHKQNKRIWARENPYVFKESHTQYPQKVNVWLGFIGNRVLGPIFIDGSLNSTKYLELLQGQVGPLILDNYNAEIIFQHDGAPPHSTAEVTNFLNNAFPGSWIGRYGPFKWPPRSPDLAPLDYFGWGYLASNVYTQDKPANAEELKNKIIIACQAITPRHLQNVRRNFYERLGYCLFAAGGHFEPYLK